MTKYLFPAALILVLAASCKTDKKQATAPVIEKDTATTSILEQVAQAHGYAQWNEVAELRFVFNVDREGNHFERSWSWKPKTNDVVYTTREDTVAYNRHQMDSTLARTDAGFINDKFWLLAPYQLIWDRDSFTYEHSKSATAPISKSPMQKLTITYGAEGGYTPGDAYDLYFEDDLIIREWVFRKGNQEEPSMITSWEDYKDHKGLKIATMHKMPDSDFQLYFTEIAIK
ncbi:hypothetical protein [Maribacter sp. 2307ULW6-5]|uniref:hypothetical protein n=1 Tax=Maribacter sp. 2307ULW6-5 TaxID=3386275 RepID=UPI0039BCB609